MVPLDLAVFPALLELLASAVKSVLVVQVALLAPLENVVPLVVEVFLELTDPQDLKVDSDLISENLELCKL